MAYMHYMDLAVPRKAVKFNHSLTHLEIDILNILVNITLEWMPEDLIDSKSTLI